ncbi:UBX domain-containing protein [Novymonas esmeraldas]|uniref:UBX domain-containing protein n=1 Tax=Novymonas esmeraldas TaxID=1808958 RepID=A0AAW0EX31_9TRYP
MGDVDVVANFVVITGATEDQAIYYLSMHDFDLANAVVAFQTDHTSASPPQLPGDSPHHSSVDTGSPLSAPSPASHQVEGFAFPNGPARPPTPPAQRALASSTAEAIQRLFARPDYVLGSDKAAFETECTKAAARRCWVVVSIVDNTFPCECFTRDVWASEAMRSLTSGSLFCYEINITHTRGRALADKYHLDDATLPRLFLVDPVTQFRVKELPLHCTSQWRYDSALVVDALMLFLTTNEPPHDPFASSEPATQDATGRRGGGPDVDTRGPMVIDVDEGDSEAEMVSPPTISRGPAGPTAAATAAAATATTATTTAAAPVDVAEVVHIVAPSPVSLDEYTVPEGADASAGGVFRLRCRLPHASPTLQLRPDTPVSRLVEYLAYLVYAEEVSRYTAPPSIAIFSGFPPKSVATGEMAGVTLQTWTGVRSGDVLIVRVNA